MQGSTSSCVGAASSGSANSVSCCSKTSDRTASHQFLFLTHSFTAWPVSLLLSSLPFYLFVFPLWQFFQSSGCFKCHFFGGCKKLFYEWVLTLPCLVHGGQVIITWPSVLSSLQQIILNKMPSEVLPFPALLAFSLPVSWECGCWSHCTPW